MAIDWIRIYTNSDFYKSELVRHILLENDVEAVLFDKQGFPYKLGEVEVHIHKKDFQKAIEIIISNEL